MLTTAALDKQGNHKHDVTRVNSSSKLASARRHQRRRRDIIAAWHRGIRQQHSGSIKLSAGNSTHRVASKRVKASASASAGSRHGIISAAS